MGRARRDVVKERARNCCEYCQMPQALDVRPFQLDHVRAEKHRGMMTLTNLAWACMPCNSFKGPNIAGYDPESQELSRLFHPRFDTWADHFRWDGPLLMGIDPIGRTTIDVLRINSEDRVAHRRMLIELELFPSQQGI